MSVGEQREREKERESNPDLGVSNLNLASCECMLNQQTNCSSHRYKLNLRDKGKDASCSVLINSKEKPWDLQWKMNAFLRIARETWIHCKDTKQNKDVKGEFQSF